ncbi:MAG: YibE/F family protein [bacterium]|nr:MAG: YibE/F family protein [bacterium]
MFKRIITASILLCLLFITPKIVGAQSEETFEGKVVRIIEEEGYYQKLDIKATSGTYKNSNLIVENGMYATSDIFKYKVGDSVVLASSSVDDGEELFVILDHIRRPALGYLFTIFVVLAVLVAGKWGLYSILGMAYSFYVIFVFILPMIIKGYNPVLTAIVGSLFIIPVTFGLSHGLNRKTIVAMLGTFISMILVGILSLVFVSLAKLTGFAAEEASFLQYQLGEMINLKGILLAGIIISTLGVMDDITVSQASVVAELKSANPKLSKKELFVRSMRVGKDHIASLVNTLVLVYTGASLPLLLLFVNNPHPFLEVINYEIVAEEIVRTLVGSIGLVLAVPITSFIAAYYALKIKK